MNTLQKLALSNYKWARERAEAAVAIFQQYSKGNIEKEKFISLLETLINPKILEKDANDDHLKLELVAAIEELYKSK